MINGYTAVAMTKLDILDELDEIKIGVRYLKNGEPMKHFPSSVQVRDLPHMTLMMVTYMTPAEGDRVPSTLLNILFAGL